MDAPQLRLQLGAGDRVQRPERLVHQQHRRVRGQTARHADPLLLPSGERVRVGLAQPRRVQPQQGQQLVDARVHPPAVPAEQVRDGRDIAGHGPVGEQAAALDHVTHTPA